MRLVPVSLAEANAFVDKHHRHHPPTQGHKFSVGVADDEGNLRGVVVVGRPVARARDDGLTLEVTRLCTDGHPNACSMLYGAAARAAFSMGYERIGTYILASENGTSLKASGWHLVAERKGRPWTGTHGAGKRRSNLHDLGDKQLWEVTA